MSTGFAALAEAVSAVFSALVEAGSLKALVLTLPDAFGDPDAFGGFSALVLTLPASLAALADEVFSAFASAL